MLKQQYIDLANNYLNAFADLLGIDRSMAIWEGNPGSSASVGGFIHVKYHNIRYTVDNNLSREQFSTWYNKSLDKKIDWDKVRPHKTKKDHG